MNATQNHYKHQSKNFQLLFLILSVFLQISHSANTIPTAWNYNPTLIQCGKCTISSPSNATVPSYPGLNYNITFKKLTSSNTQYTPAVGFVDLSYLFSYNARAHVTVLSYLSTSTTFLFRAQADDSSAKLTHYSINYLAVSNDFKDFYIWIDFGGGISVNQQINTTNPFYGSNSLSKALPTTSNINTLISVADLDLYILQASTYLFDLQVTINIVNNTHYSWKITSLSANTFVNWIHFYVVFYQQVISPYQQTLLIPFSFSWSAATSSTAQIVHLSNLIDTFEVNVNNSFFGLSRICSIWSVDFKINYLTSFQMHIAFNQTKAITASTFIFRQLPICPTYYVLNLAHLICVCNNIKCYQGIGCSSVIAIEVNSICLFCSIIDNFVMDSNGNCVCKTGYQLNNQTCLQICGDRIKFNDQCDDGNNASGDGCSPQCSIQSGFQCYQHSSGTSVCLFKQNICFNLTKIQKNDDNSAVFTFQAIGNTLPLAFSINDFEVKKTLNLTILRNESTNYGINYSIKNIYGQIIQVLVNFQETIEGYNATIDFNFNSTKYLSQDCTLNFACKGSELPLIFSKYNQQYQLLEKINLIFIVVLSIIFIISMLAPKWIGVEAMQVSQLIFFSQLLITDASNWPVAFQIFTYLKYSNGFNNIFCSQVVQTFSNNSKKWKFLDFESAFIFNFSISFFLILVFIILYFLLRPAIKKNQNQFLQQKDKTKKKDLIQSISNQNNIQRRFYQFVVNVAILSFLQFLASIVSQFQILIYPFNKYNFFVPLQVNTLLMLASLFFIIFIGFNIFSNSILNQSAFRILKQKPQLQYYKRVNTCYHFIIGASIFCFNSFSIKGIPISTFFFIAEFLYIIYTCKLRPYKQCVWIHSIGFLFNRFGYLTFLGFITIKNLFVNINEVIMLYMCYIVAAFILIMILLSIIRLYFDLRFGEEYQKEIEDRRKEKQLEQKLRTKKQQQYDLQEIKQQALKKKQKKDIRQIKDKNKYRIENIVLQERQIELLQFVQKKNWTKLQKQKYYYEKYTQKPLIWLQKHDKKQHQIKMKEKLQKNKSKQYKKMNERDQRDKEELEKFKKEKRQELTDIKLRKKKKIQKKKQ